MALAQAAAADRSADLPSPAIDAAVARCGVDFAASEHGRTQRAIIDRLGQGGRLAVTIGVAGAGKSTLLAPLVDAWQASGRTVFGAALAWRQSDDLEKAGIPDARRAAMSRFLEDAQAGKLTPDRNSVVVVDELGQLGTRQLLALLRAAGGARVPDRGGGRRQAMPVDRGRAGDRPAAPGARRRGGAGDPDHGAPADRAGARHQPAVSGGAGGRGAGDQARRRHGAAGDRRLSARLWRRSRRCGRSGGRRMPATRTTR